MVVFHQIMKVHTTFFDKGQILNSNGELLKQTDPSLVFCKIDSRVKEWELFTGEPVSRTDISYSIHKIESGFTFESLFDLFSLVLDKIAYEPDEVLDIVAKMKDKLPLIPATAYFLVRHAKKLYVFRTYIRPTGECELYVYQLEESDVWAALDSWVFTNV